MPAGGASGNPFARPKKRFATFRVYNLGCPSLWTAFLDGSGKAATGHSLRQIGNSREEKSEEAPEKEKQSSKSRSGVARATCLAAEGRSDRKSTRLNSS